jgi:transposase
MGAPYAQDLRDRVLRAYDHGMKTKQIADVFAVSAAWARRIKQRRRETGETTPRSMGGATVVKIDMQQLAVLVREQPDATAKELQQRLGSDCCESSIYVALKRLGFTFKKRRSMPQNKIVRTSLSGVSNGKASSPESMRSS